MENKDTVNRYDLTLKVWATGSFPSPPPPDGVSHKVEIAINEPLTVEEANELGNFLVKVQKRISNHT